MKHQSLPLGSFAACIRDGVKVPFGENMGFKAPCEPSRWKVGNLLMGFTRVLALFFFVIFLLPASSAVSAEIYKWKDKDGNIFYSDTPPPHGADAETREFKEESIEKPKRKASVPTLKRENIQERRPYKDVNVIMYMTSWCPYCSKARNYLRSLEVNLIEYDIEKDRGRREEMLSKSGGSRGVPLIDIEGIIIKGYNSDAMKKAIEIRRNR
jgi:glutaredoxin